MSEYRRAIVPGGVFFFTVVTYRRSPLFADPDNVGYLRDAFLKIRAVRPFDIDGIVVLPDHLHCIWQLLDGDSDFSGRWREIKKATSRAIHPESDERWERPVWQRRFWEHAIRDGEDWRIHMDYLHYNPVKHGYAAAPSEWPWSSLWRNIQRRWYPESWGRLKPLDIADLDCE